MGRNKKFSWRELKEFKKILLKLQEKILEDIRTLTKDTLEKSPKDAAGDLSGYTFHMADVASDTFEREFSLSLVANEQNTLRQIEEALKRIESKEYGICVICGERISKKRLKVIPYALYCLKCQSQKEKES